MENTPGNSRQRDLLPLPLPFKGGDFALPVALSRCSLRRIHARQAWQSWANSGVLTLNHLYKPKSFCSSPPNRAQTAALGQFCNKYRSMGKPPNDLTPARALRELCHQSVPYITDVGGPIPFDEGRMSLPAPGGAPTSPLPHLAAEHRNLIEGSCAPMLRSVADAEHVLEESGLSKPFVDPSFRSGKVYGKFLNMLIERDLVELQEGGNSHLGVFFVEKKMVNSE